MLGASELEDKLVNALNRGMAKWTQKLRSMNGSGTPPNNGGKAKPNQPKPEVETKLNIGGDTPVKKEVNREVATRSVDPGVLGASELEDKLVSALNRGMAKWTQELQSMNGGGSPPKNGGKAKPNQPKPEAEAKLNIGGETPVRKETNLSLIHI